MNTKENCKLFTEESPETIEEKLKSMGISVKSDVGDYLDVNTVLNAVFETFSKMQWEDICHD